MENVMTRSKRRRSTSISRRDVHRSAPRPPAAASRSASTCRSRGVAQAGGAGECGERSQRLGRDQARRHLRDPHRALRRWGRARSPALAQLVAEELECDWKKVTTEADHARPQSRAQTRLGRDGHRRQPRHPQLAGLCSPRRRARRA